MEEEEDNYPLFCREYKLLYYFDVMEKGKKIVRWPPPWFIPTVTLLQIVLFCVNYFGDGALVKYLQFHT